MSGSRRAQACCRRSTRARPGPGWDSPRAERNCAAVRSPRATGRRPAGAVPCSGSPCPRNQTVPRRPARRRRRAAMAATAALRQGGGGALQDGRRGSGHGRGVRDEDDAGRGGTGQQPWVPAPPPEIAAEPPRQHELRDDQAGVDQLRCLAGELRLAGRGCPGAGLVMAQGQSRVGDTGPSTANWPAWATRWRPQWCGRSSRTRASTRHSGGPGRPGGRS